MGDAGTGMQAALAISAAYAQRLRTGKGQLIELSMQEAMTYYLRTAVSSTGFGAKPTGRSGNGGNPFSALYPCSPGGSNDYIYIMAVNQRMWDAVCTTIGKPDLLSESQFDTPRKRHENSQALYEEIAAWTRTRTKQECMSQFAESGVCASAVYQTDELFTDPHLLERNFIKQVTHRDYGNVRILGWPARMSESSVEPVASPLLGEHTDQVLVADLGLCDEELDELKNKGVIGQEELNRLQAKAAG